jgi:hypothetical protein
MKEVILNDQESLRLHIIECKRYFPNISTCRIFLNLLLLFQEKYYVLNVEEKISFLHYLYEVSGVT